MKKHTPAPWRAVKQNGWKVFDRHGGMVADCHFFDQSDSQREANAVIIAAAPEILDLLRRFKKVFEAPHPSREADLYNAMCDKIKELDAWMQISSQSAAH